MMKSRSRESKWQQFSQDHRVGCQWLASLAQLSAASPLTQHCIQRGPRVRRLLSAQTVGGVTNPPRASLLPSCPHHCPGTSSPSP